MSSPEDDGSLQFDQAEYSHPQAVSIDCKACGGTIAGHYYDVNGLIVCDGCCQRFTQEPSGSERFRRFIRAGIRGSLAAFAGFMLFYVVMKVTGLKIGLISIVVGFMVGGAVHHGSGRRGGWVYQLLAIFLTYTAISASYTMMAIPQIMEIVPNAAIDKPLPADADKQQLAAKKAAAAGPRQVNTPELVGGFVIFALVSLIFMYAFPIYAGFSSPIGLLIIAFGLWEAGKLNRRVVNVIQGPFSLAGIPATTNAIESSPINEADADE